MKSVTATLPASGASAIKTRGLARRFGDLLAVEPLDLSIRYGEIFGLLGPNGAGKTTALSMLCTLLSPSEGTAHVNGFDVGKDSYKVRRSIGIVFQDESVDEELSGWENLDLHGRLYGMDSKKRQMRIREVLDLVGLYERRDDLLRTYSGGMIRRLEIARGLMHHPKVLFLDEPTLGLDPQTRRHLWKYVRKLNETEGVTVVLTTHYLEEADALCDRIAIIDKGRIVALDSPENLKGKKARILVGSPTPSKLETALSSLSPKRVGERFSIHTDRVERTLARVLALAKKNGAALSDLDVKKPSLEDVFLSLTGHELREEKAGRGERFKVHSRAFGRRR